MLSRRIGWAVILVGFEFLFFWRAEKYPPGTIPVLTTTLEILGEFEFNISYLKRREILRVERYLKPNWDLQIL